MIAADKLIELQNELVLQLVAEDGCAIGLEGDRGVAGGVTIAIARGDVACPVKALREWLGAAGIEAGRYSARSTRRPRWLRRG